MTTCNFGTLKHKLRLKIYQVFYFFIQAVTKMIQEAYTYVEQTPNLETKLKLIDTLRTITAGKVTELICVYNK